MEYLIKNKGVDNMKKSLNLFLDENLIKANCHIITKLSDLKKDIELWIKKEINRLANMKLELMDVLEVANE